MTKNGKLWQLGLFETISIIDSKYTLGTYISDMIAYEITKEIDHNIINRLLNIVEDL